MRKELLENYINYLATPPPWSESGKPRTRYITKWRTLAENDPITKHNDLLDLSKISKEKIWIWSDHHFDHKNVIKYTNRPFNNTDEMNEHLIKAASCIKSDDVSIWVGDVGFCSTTRINEEFLSKIPGYKILVIGNHDFQSKRLRPLNFDEIHVGYYLEINDIKMFFTHYPIEDTRFLLEGIYNVHGHTHTKLIEGENFINVCVEHTEYKPLNFLQLENKIRNKNEKL